MNYLFYLGVSLLSFSLGFVFDLCLERSISNANVALYAALARMAGFIGSAKTAAEAARQNRFRKGLRTLCTLRRTFEGAIIGGSCSCPLMPTHGVDEILALTWNGDTAET